MHPLENVLIIGASTGIGFETAKLLAGENRNLILVCRNDLTAQQTKEKILALVPVSQINTLTCNLENPEDINALAAKLTALVNCIDVCVFNAACIMPRRTLTAAGLEVQLAVNHLASFALCNLLLPLFKASSGCKLIFLSSRVYKIAGINTPLLLGQTCFYHPTLAYAESKLLSAIFATYLGGKLNPRGIKVCLIHPGLVSTEIGNKHAAFFQGLLWNLMKAGGRLPIDAAKEIVAVLEKLPNENRPVIWFKGKASALEAKITDPENVEKVLSLSYKLFPGLNRDMLC